MIAAFCDGCLEEFVSNDKADLIAWVRVHNEHRRTLDVEFIPHVSVDPVLGIRKDGILQREGMKTALE
jgi:hypothetical protein